MVKRGTCTNGSSPLETWSSDGELYYTGIARKNTCLLPSTLQMPEIDKVLNL
jgi:hypothetical protein